MFIILEGVDGAGKSDLAAAIERHIRHDDPDSVVQMLHAGQLTQPPLDAYVHSVGDYTPTSNRHIVADRWHYGEEIYGPLYRGKSALTVGQFRWIELWLASRGATAWHVTQPLDVLQRRLAARGEDFLQSHHVDLVRQQFHTVSDAAITCFGVVSPEGDVTELAERVVKRAQFSEHEIGTLAHRYPSYVGGPLPHTLLVGEKRGGSPPYKTTSAFMPVGGNSAEFLLSALNDTWWREIGLVNAVEEGERLTTLVSELFDPVVVALGKVADGVLTDLGIQHAAVPHPQYVRRFHSGKKVEYGIMVREAARTGERMLKWLS